MTKSYTSKDIQKLTDQQHVRLRTNVYFGSTKPDVFPIVFIKEDSIEIKDVEFVPAVYKAVGEIIDNSIDELTQLNKRNKQITISAEPEKGRYVISDNGRGVPVDKHSTGEYTPQVVFGHLRSGRNFSDDKDKGVRGQNGVGSSCTNFCSSEFEIKIQRDSKVYKQKFTKGGLKASKPSIRSTQSKITGTSIGFQLDEQVFENISLDSEFVENWAREVAFTNPGITVEYNKEKIKFKTGLDEILKAYSKNTDTPVLTSVYEDDKCTINLHVLTTSDIKHNGNLVCSYVNSGYLFNGGICNTQIANAFTDQVITHLNKKAAKEKVEIKKQDFIDDVFLVADIKVKDPEYDSQSKTRLTSPNLRKEIQTVVNDAWPSFMRKNKVWLEDVIEKARRRSNSSISGQAKKQHLKNLKKKIVGLTDATSNARPLCQILVTEGQSASSMVTDVRDPEFMGIFPLTGKINNVHGTTVHQLSKMSKLEDLLLACGLTAGLKATSDTMRFGKIVIATDGDADGGDIMSLLVNLFYTFWPEMFSGKRPIVHRLVVPNVCVVKGDKRIHFQTSDEYNKHKSKYKSWTVHYYKGLGSLTKKDWEMVLDSKDCLIPIVEDGKLQDTLALLFGPDADARKTWLQD